MLSIYAILKVLVIPAIGAFGSKVEKQLFADLFKGYNPAVRPVLNISHTVTVRMDIAVTKVLDMDERNQLMTLVAWLRFYWVDEHLRWNASDYEGVSNIIVPLQQVWLHDITLYNNAREGVDFLKINAISVSSTGGVMWLQPTTLKTSCEMDVFYFPYDTQRCKLTFGPWLFHGGQVDVDIVNKNPKGDSANYNTDGEWNLLEIDALKETKYYSCCPEPYPSVTFTVVLNRRWLYYMFNLFLPCVLLSFMSLVVFYLPCDSGEKVSLSVTILLSLTVFLLIISEAMPPTSDFIPIIGQYYVSTMILLSLSTSTTVVVLSIHHRGNFTAAPPVWLKRILFSNLATVLCLQSHVTKVNSKSEDEIPKLTKEALKSNAHKRLSVISLSNDADYRKEAVFFHQNGRIRPMPVVPRSPSPTRLQTPNGNLQDNHVVGQGTDHYLRDMRDSICGQDSSALVKLEWSMVALVIDRVLLVMFSTMTLLLIIGILVRLSSGN